MSTWDWAALSLILAGAPIAAMFESWMEQRASRIRRMRRGEP